MPTGIYKRTKPPWNKGTKGIMKSWLKGKKGYTNAGSFKKGHIISEKIREKISKSHIAGKYTREKSSAWKGGRAKHTEGYILINKKEHPFSNHSGYIFEHRLVMETYLGRYLTPVEVVHHINGIKTDNRIKNLMLFVNKSGHQKFHKIFKRK